MALRDHYLEAPARFKPPAGIVNIPDPQDVRSQTETFAPEAEPQIAVETIEAFSRFEEIEPYWNNLFARSAAPGNIFQSFNWHWHWCNHYLPDCATDLRIVAVWSDDRLIMVWPLVLTRSLGVRRLTWMGAPVSQYGDVLIDAERSDGKLLGQVWNYIVRHINADVIALEKVRDDCAVGRFLKQTGAIVTARDHAPCLDLASACSFEDYEKRYSGRTRKNRRRHRRRLNELDAVHVEVLTEGKAAREMVGRAISCKRKWLKDKGLASRAFADPKFEAFFSDVAGSTDRSVGCMVGLLYSGPKPVAYDISFKSGKTCVAHIGAYEAEFERYGPGGILTEESIRHCFALGVEVYDFLAPKSEHKMSWADGCVGVGDYAYPLNSVGQVYARGGLWFVRSAIKKIFEHLPASARRLALPFVRLAGY